MKMLNQERLRRLALGLSLLAAGVAGAADAPPKRQAGLWELQAQGRPMAGRMCVGNDEDFSRHEKPEGGRGDCDPPSWRKLGADRWAMEQVCRMPGSKATHRSEVSGDFSKQIQVRTETHYEPPRAGKADVVHEMAFARVGDCPAGVKPGSMVLPNGMVLDPSKMMGGAMPKRP